jgi:hypothetical protein
MEIVAGRLKIGVFDICNPSASMFDAQLFLQP